MINFTLIFWIIGCAGEKCPIESHIFEPFTTQELCLEARDEKRKNPYAFGFPHAAYCLVGEYPKDQDKDAS